VSKSLKLGKGNVKEENDQSVPFAVHSHRGAGQGGFIFWLQPIALVQSCGLGLEGGRCFDISFGINHKNQEVKGVWGKK